MALSEHEKKALDQIAQELEHDDPKFASKMRATLLRTKARHTASGIFTALVGFIVLLTGVGARTPALGIVGFTIMGVGTYLATMRVASLRLPRRPSDSPSMGPAEMG